MRFLPTGYVSMNKGQLLEQLYAKYNKLMYYVAYNILHDSFLAEDAVQSAFLKLSKNRFEIDSISSNKTKAFMVIIIRNISIGIYNAKKKENLSYVEDELAEQPDDKILPLDIVISNESMHNIKKAIARLDCKYSDVIIMRYFSDYSIAEIATFFDVSQQVVRVRLHRAKKMLMDCLIEVKAENE